MYPVNLRTGTVFLCSNTKKPEPAPDPVVAVLTVQLHRSGHVHLETPLGPQASGDLLQRALTAVRQAIP
jgi:hypothetical protein